MLVREPVPGHSGHRWRTGRGRCPRSWWVTLRPPEQSVAIMCQHRRRRAERPVYRAWQRQAGDRSAGDSGGQDRGATAD